MPRPATDERGFITEGPFAGLHEDEVFRFAETAASASPASAPRPASPASPPAQDPNTTLARTAADRVTPMQEFTFAQLEARDEADFSRTVSDYDKYKEKIVEQKKQLNPAQRAQVGLHKFIYANLRMQDPEIQAKIFGTTAPVPPPEPVVPPVEPPAEPPPAAPTAPVTPPAAPKAAPAPVAPPTPRAAVPPPTGNDRKPRLQATPKISELANRWNMPINDYLIQLEDKGYTQDDVNALSQPVSRATGTATKPRSVFDAPRASRT